MACFLVAAAEAVAVSIAARALGKKEKVHEEGSGVSAVTIPVHS